MRVPVNIGQQQQDVRPQPQDWVSRFAIILKQGLAFRGLQVDTAVHGLVSWVCRPFTNVNSKTKPVFITRSIFAPLSLLPGFI
jgi:hypothetical protein